MSPRLTAAITVAIHELKRRPYSTIRNDTVAELEAALAAEEKCPYCAAATMLGSVFYDQNCTGCVTRMTAK